MCHTGCQQSQDMPSLHNTNTPSQWGFPVHLHCMSLLPHPSRVLRAAVAASATITNAQIIAATLQVTSSRGVSGSSLFRTCSICPSVGGRRVSCHQSHSHPPSGISPPCNCPKQPPPHYEQPHYEPIASWVSCQLAAAMPLDRARLTPGGTHMLQQHTRTRPVPCGWGINCTLLHSSLLLSSSAPVAPISLTAAPFWALLQGRPLDAGPCWPPASPHVAATTSLTCDWGACR